MELILFKIVFFCRNFFILLVFIWEVLLFDNLKEFFFFLFINVVKFVLLIFIFLVFIWFVIVKVLV